MRVSGLSILALYGAASLAATVPGSTSSNTTPVNKDTATIAPRGSKLSAAVNISKCSDQKPGADHSAWYQECMDKLFEEKSFRGGVGFPVYSVTVGDYLNGSGCQCTYSNGKETGRGEAWDAARGKLWADVVSKDHSCKYASYVYRPESKDSHSTRYATWMEFRCK